MFCEGENSQAGAIITLLPLFLGGPRRQKFTDDKSCLYFFDSLQYTYMHKSIAEKFRTNVRMVWVDNRWFFIIFLAALLADMLSTIYFMRKFGPESEIHPVIRLLSRHFGVIAGPLLGFAGKALGGFIVAVFLGKWSRYLFVAATIISFWAAWFNIWGAKIIQHTPNILHWATW